MVEKFLDLNNLSWPRRPFALSNDGRKVWATVSFRSAMMQRKVTHVIFIVFLPYLQDHGLLRSTNFATMATYGNDFSLWACGNNQYGNIEHNLSWCCVGAGKPFMGKEDTYHFVTARPSGKSAGCCNPEAPSFSPLLAASWICSRQSRVHILGHAFLPCI